MFPVLLQNSLCFPCLKKSKNQIPCLDLNPILLKMFVPVLVCKLLCLKTKHLFYVLMYLNRCILTYYLPLKLRYPIILHLYTSSSRVFFLFFVFVFKNMREQKSADNTDKCQKKPTTHLHRSGLRISLGFMLCAVLFLF